MKKNIVGVGMSGGVDSSVAAYLLKEQGYDVLGITMKLINNEKTQIAIEDAKRVCDDLGIKHYVIDLCDEFRKVVISNFVEAYKNGETPNPCCVCNKFFKFGLFFQEAKRLGCDFISTGDYARIIDGKLYRAKILEKDQSYFLWGVDKDVLKYVLLPLQDYDNKEEIREIAKKAGLSVNNKKDSQEVCFVPNDDYKAYLKGDFGIVSSVGDICLKDGCILGKHTGLINYTVGQRKGLNISYKEPLYVLELDLDKNMLIVGSDEDLFSSKFIAKDFNCLVQSFPDEIFAKVRSRGKLKKCEIIRLEDNKVFVSLFEKERAITKGQSVVFYDKNDCCLGGATIEKNIK